MTKTIDLTYDDLVDALYDRLRNVQHELDNIDDVYDDNFNDGVFTTLSGEELWLLSLLDKVEKSR